MNEKIVATPNKKVMIDIRNSALIAGNKRILLSSKQIRFFVALLNGVTQKQEIIRHVWDNSPSIDFENNYHQLIFQVRRVLKNTGLPPELIQTLPRHGIQINTDALISSQGGLRDLLNRLVRRRHT